jgi:hypothetical protein
MAQRSRIFRGEEDEDTDDDEDDESKPMDPVQAIPEATVPPKVPSMEQSPEVTTPGDAEKGRTANSSESIMLGGMAASVLPMVEDVSTKLAELLHNQQVSQTCRMNRVDSLLLSAAARDSCITAGTFPPIT